MPPVKKITIQYTVDIYGFEKIIYLTGDTGDWVSDKDYTALLTLRTAEAAELEAWRAGHLVRCEGPAYGSSKQIGVSKLSAFGLPKATDAARVEYEKHNNETQ